MIPSDPRTQAMTQWLENDLSLSVNSYAPASSDASFRRYFRVNVANDDFIVMDAPPDKEDIARFIKVADLLRHANVKVPLIFQQNLPDGFLLLEDFGSQLYLDNLNENSADGLYQRAFDSLFNLQSNTPLTSCGLPAYDLALLERELNIFTEWFVDKRLEMTLPKHIWNVVSTVLIDSALEQPVTCVHRDYHSRNLMIIDQDSPGVIDFQDAVIGPITYDLVSLLRDCYINWPEEFVDQWMTNYFQRLEQAKLVDCGLERFRRWFDLMGMQRHLKAIGIFSRLDLRDGKSGYLKDIPRTLAYVTQVAARYPELAEFGEYLENINLADKVSA
ncbi:MAG: phosphotransferase [Methylococcaceae bacterium]|nr:phosphotransferase [Methylococcaceae bacterium]